MPCSTDSPLASSTRSSAYFTVRITCPPVLKTPNPSTVSFVQLCGVQLNTIGDKQQPFLTPLPVFTFLVSPLSSRTLTQIHVQFVDQHSFVEVTSSFLYKPHYSGAADTVKRFYYSLKQAHNSTSVSKVHSNIILGITIAFLVSFPLPNPNWSSPGTSSVFFSIFLRILTNLFLHRVMWVKWNELILYAAFHFILIIYYFIHFWLIRLSTCLHKAKSFRVKFLLVNTICINLFRALVMQNCKIFTPFKIQALKYLNIFVSVI